MDAITKIFVLLVFALVFLGGCGDEGNGSGQPVDEDTAAASEDCPTEEVVTSSGLRYTEVECGDGEEAQKGDTLEVHYVGTLENGKKFDSSRDRGQTFQFQVGAGQVIAGWDEGLIGMKEGGIRELTIPPDLAYGAAGAPPAIPPNATLIFEVELVSIVN